MRQTVTAILDTRGLDGLLKLLGPALHVVLDKAAHDVERRAKEQILAGAKSGLIYGEHQASAPGEAPANDLGVLAAGISVGDGDGPLSRVVASSAGYSADLELGTTKIAPRPFLGPALESVRQPFGRAVRKVIESGA